MNMLVHMLILTLLAAVTVIAVRLLILPGLDRIANRLNLSSKIKGQLLGYATSMPELVVIIASAWAGVFSAGFWNIASSNIINWILFLIALFFYRRQWDLKNKKFIDELLFAVLSVVIPLVLLKIHIPLSAPTAVFLILIFVFYKVIDRRANPLQSSGQPTRKSAEGAGNPLPLGILLLALGIICITVCGNLLGKTAEELIHTLGIPAWMIGWILGLITSLPEMTSFFGIYAQYKKRNQPASTDDTQEAVDALVASNMSNLGIILPVGVLLFVLLR